jgi:DNA invertase Pin-like site-specific DNA recombinase
MTREQAAAAKARGVKFGRHQKRPTPEYIAELRKQGWSWARIGRAAGCSDMTVRRVAREAADAQEEKENEAWLTEE